MLEVSKHYNNSIPASFIIASSILDSVDPRAEKIILIKNKASKSPASPEYVNVKFISIGLNANSSIYVAPITSGSYYVSH